MILSRQYSTPTTCRPSRLLVNTLDGDDLLGRNAVLLRRHPVWYPAQQLGQGFQVLLYHVGSCVYSDTEQRPVCG